MNIIRKVSTGKASLFSTYWFICFPIGFVINLPTKPEPEASNCFSFC
jgi:hypothetical protein